MMIVPKHIRWFVFIPNTPRKMSAICYAMPLARIPPITTPCSPPTQESRRYTTDVQSQSPPATVTCTFPSHTPPCIRSAQPPRLESYASSSSSSSSRPAPWNPTFSLAQQTHLAPLNMTPDLHNPPRSMLLLQPLQHTQQPTDPLSTARVQPAGPSKHQRKT